MRQKATHKEVIDLFLSELNARTNKYILKGSVALNKCFGLERVSDNINLDGPSLPFLSFCKDFADEYGLSCQVVKDTNVSKHCLLDCGDKNPLRVELSAMRAHIPEEEITLINGITVYNIDTLTMSKIGAYLQRNKLCDLYDVVYIANNFFDKLSPLVQFGLQNALQYKGIEHFDLKSDKYFDSKALAKSFAEALQKVGLE